MIAGSERQTTVAATAEGEGIGLHTGERVRFCLTPAAPDEGIVFIRVDLPGAPSFCVTPETVNVSALQRRTELIGPGGVTVATPEHLLAACLGLGLDNVRVELDGPELPIYDGSVLPFIEAIRRAGLREVDAPRRFWRLLRPVHLVREHAEIMAVPAERMNLVFCAELRHAGLDNQTATVTLGGDEFATKVAPARTFCFYDDIEKLRAAGLIRGGSIDCAIVIRDGQPLEGDYRLPNELAAHKLIDLIGDLATLGRPVRALITARGTGHALHHAFIEQLRKELTNDV